jgi:hypothetical protein
LLLFPRITSLNVAGRAPGWLPISLARGPRAYRRAIVVGGIFLWNWTEAIPGDAATGRARRAAHPGSAATR